MPYRSKFCLLVAVLMIVAGSFLLIKPALAYKISQKDNSVFVSGCSETDYFLNLFNASTDKRVTEFTGDLCVSPNVFELTENNFNNDDLYAILVSPTISCCGYEWSFKGCKWFIEYAGQNPKEKSFYYPLGIVFFQNNFIADILAYAGRLFSDLYILIALTIGLPLAFWIIKKIINLWKKEDLEDRRHRTFADRDFEYKRKNYHWKGD